MSASRRLGCLLFGLLISGIPTQGRTAEPFGTLHEVLRHFDVAFVDRANPSALLLGAMEGMQQAAPDVQIKLKGYPDLIQIQAGDDSLTIRRSVLRGIPDLEKALVQAASLVVEHKLCKSAKALEQAMVRQIVAHCGDPWSVYLDSDLYGRLLDDGTRAMGSIGLLVEQWGDGLRVLDVLHGSPAGKAGIRRGMAVERIAGRSALELNELEALALMRGATGSKVEIQVAGKTYSLELAEEARQNLEVNPLAGGIAHVRILNFRPETGRRLAAVMRKLSEHFQGQLKGLILDLRGNPGGLVTEGTEVVGLLSKAGKVVSVVSKKHQKIEVEQNQRPGPYRDLPLVLLVDHRSASVSEIVALAMKDTGRAKLVGEKTLGKGTVQVVLELLNGSALKLSTGRYYSPIGTPIFEGIEPDLEVPWDGLGSDPQLAAALKLLQNS
jgi:C-terminal peptidase prc